MSESVQAAILADGQGRAIRIRNGNVIFKTVGAETNGQVGIFEQTMQKGDPGPVPHFHKETTEMFYLLEGSLDFVLDGSPRVVEAGGFVRVPPIPSITSLSVGRSRLAS